MDNEVQNITVLQKALDKVIEWNIDSVKPKIDLYVDNLRDKNPGISVMDLARMIMSRKSLKCGLVGATTGIPGIIALPATVPANLVAAWRIQIEMALAIARVFNEDLDFEKSDLKTDIYLILAGNSAKEALKRLGIETGKAVTKKMVNKYVTREVMKKIWKIIPQKIITKAGEKSATSFMKMVPLVGAPIGFGVDYASTRVVGNFAIKYYSGIG